MNLHNSEQRDSSQRLVDCCSLWEAQGSFEPLSTAGVGGGGVPHHPPTAPGPTPPPTRTPTPTLQGLGQMFLQAISQSKFSLLPLF